MRYTWLCLALLALLPSSAPAAEGELDAGGPHPLIGLALKGAAILQNAVAADVRVIIQLRVVNQQHD